jgi:hypothetical protein
MMPRRRRRGGSRLGREVDGKSFCDVEKVRDGGCERDCRQLRGCASLTQITGAHSHKNEKWIFM